MCLWRCAPIFLSHIPAIKSSHCVCADCNNLNALIGRRRRCQRCVFFAVYAADMTVQSEKTG